MRRDYFELDVENVDWVDTDGEPRKPAVRIDFHGPSPADDDDQSPERLLRERLTRSDGTLLDASETDVAFRLQAPLEEPDAGGVVGVTDRVTGDFILELNEDADDVLTFIRAARAYGQAGDDDGQYVVDITVDGDELVTYEKNTFLVYDVEGNLLRSQSLIPSGVEL